MRREPENALRQIDAYHCILRHGCRPFLLQWLYSTIMAHCDAVEGGRQPPHLQSGPQPLNSDEFQTQPRRRSG